ncbi:MAG: sugar phosphate isomerase/epimerase [Planctomycetota bacterium]|nr:MAG: sugar phosphate isomerase/epimerase [Planctomycetota bacterium]
MRSREQLNRRELFKSVGVVLGSTVFSRPTTADEAARSLRSKPTVCLFSKPLQNRPLTSLAALLPELSCNAVDLTCRPGGHVLPERVEGDLPRAYELLEHAGITIPMITTAITDADKGNAEAIIKTASGLGVRYVKLGYYRYGDMHKLHDTLADVKSRLGDVAAMCRQYGVRAGFHNHAGATVGAAMWDVWHIIRDLPAEAIGSYFDLRHATAEGGDEGWRIGMNLLAPRIIMVAVKDFIWGKDPKRGWQTKNVPLGEGMVRGEEAFRQLKELQFAGPVSLHMEYGQHVPPVGSDADKVNLLSIRRDLAFLRSLLKSVRWL